MSEWVDGWVSECVSECVRAYVSNRNSKSIFIVPYSPYGGIGPFTINVFE